MKPSAQEKAFTRDCNRVRALISFGKLKSLDDAAKELGLGEFVLNLQDAVTPSYFNAWIQDILPELRQRWAGLKVTPKIETKVEAYVQGNPVWNNDDALVESTVYLAYAHRTDRRKYLESLVPKRPANQKASCLYFQYDNALEDFYAIVHEHKTGIYIRANTGAGKTYALGQLLVWLRDCGFLEKHSMSPWKVLYVTGASIVEQTKEVLRDEFGLDLTTEFQVTNYESLRTSFGAKRYIEKIIKIEQGEEHEIWEWKKMLHPLVVVWDEGHKLKNEGSTQSKIAQACNNLDYENVFTKQRAKIYQVFASASPFSRIVHAKAFAVATGKRWKTKDGRSLRITNNNWKSIAAQIAAPADLQEYSRPAIKRFLREFKDYIYPFRNVRQKHKGILQIEYLDFENEEDRKIYKEAWETFCRFKEELEGKKYDNSRFLLLVQLGVFRQAAEKLRKNQLARLMYNAWCRGKAPIAMCAYKPIIALTMKILMDDYNVPRSKISVIWGGSSMFSGKAEDKYTKEEIHAVLKQALKDPENVDSRVIKEIHQQLMMEHDGLGDLGAELKLGVQSLSQRNFERKAFQSGQSEYCFLTYGAGKEGLSLHQNETWLRPREQFLTPVYNEMEMLQGEGRAARITSLSDTLIRTMVFKDTIEIPVLRRVLAKRQCLEVVRTHGDKLDAISSQIEEVMRLAGFSDEDDEDLEEQVFNDLEQEMSDENNKDMED